MFVTNDSSYAPVLARAHVTDDVAMMAVVVETTYRIDKSGLTPCAPPARAASDPPDIGRIALWKLVSLTAWGHALAPSKPPFVRVVELAVGARRQRLVVFGPRFWRRTALGLEPSTPARFEATALSWRHAFGGQIEVAPGYDEGGLPQPGGVRPYHLNPGGMGYYADAQRAVDRPLPLIERAEMLSTEPAARPVPGGLAPCPELPALRMLAFAEQLATRPSPSLRDMLDRALWVQHHASGDWMLPDLSPGELVTLDGLGADPIKVVVPPAPTRVSIGHGRSRHDLAPAIRSLHIDAEARVLRIVYGHAGPYAPSRPPRRIVVDDRRAA